MTDLENNPAPKKFKILLIGDRTDMPDIEIDQLGTSGSMWIRLWEVE